jgi:uncharacterized membrane protein YfcA
MTIGQALILFFAAVLGSTLNSVAGGGTFITFPTLIFTGIPSINANATSAVALWPGSVASARAYATSLKISRRLLALLIAVSVAGGLVGAFVLLRTPQATFQRLIPYLLLVATVLFAFGPYITAWVRKHTSSLGAPQWVSAVGVALLQFVVAAYGGFFGGGMSILILSGLSLLNLGTIHTMNAVKNLLAVFVNGAAVIYFVIRGAVFWPQALVMVVGAIVGGYGAGVYAQRLDPKLVRWFVIITGCVLIVYFFFTYG